MKKFYLLATSLIFAASATEIFAMETSKEYTDGYTGLTMTRSKREPEVRKQEVRKQEGFKYYPFIQSLNRREPLGDGQFLVKHHGKWYQISQGALDVVGNMHYNEKNPVSIQIHAKKNANGKIEYNFSNNGTPLFNGNGNPSMFRMKPMNFEVEIPYNAVSASDHGWTHNVAPNWGEATSGSTFTRGSDVMKLLVPKLYFYPFVDSLNKKISLGKDEKSNVGQYLIQYQKGCWFQISANGLDVIEDIYNNTPEQKNIQIRYAGPANERGNKYIFMKKDPFSNQENTLKNTKNEKMCSFRMKVIDFDVNAEATNFKETWDKPVALTWDSSNPWVYKCTDIFYDVEDTKPRSMFPWVNSYPEYRIDEDTKDPRS